jgi:hypothetical protein
MIEAHYRRTPEDWRQIMRGRCLMRHVDHEHPLALLIKDGDKQILAYAIEAEKSGDKSVTHMGIELTGALGKEVLNDEMSIYRAMIDHRACIYEIDIHAGETPRRAAMRRVDRVMTKDILPSPGASYSDFDAEALRQLDEADIKQQEGIYDGMVSLRQHEAA